MARGYGKFVSVVYIIHIRSVTVRRGSISVSHSSIIDHSDRWRKYSKRSINEHMEYSFLTKTFQVKIQSIEKGRGRLLDDRANQSSQKYTVYVVT